MLTLTEANNWTETIVFAGGVTPERDDGNQNLWHPVDTAASESLVSITPLFDNPQWVDVDDLPEGRTMDKRVLMVNGASFGTEGYGWDSWAAPYGQSYAHTPILRPAYLNTSAPQGQMWDTAAMPNSTVPRLYHSVATLVKDGSVPSPFLLQLQSYYDSPRPLPSNLPTSLSYGGSPFNVSLSAESVRDVDLEAEISVMLMRTGFSTHVRKIGARSLELPHTFSTYDDGSVTLHLARSLGVLMASSWWEGQGSHDAFALREVSCFRDGRVSQQRVGPSSEASA
ncbi:hypothetical protein JCM11641_002753 [Rhodosporidiobolus odoratus]